MNYDILFARDKLPGLVSNIALNEACNIINKPERDICEKGAGSISISAFASLVGILVDTAKYIVGIKIWAIIVAIKKYNARKKMHDKIVLLEKSKLNTIKVVTYKALIDSSANHDEFVSVNNVFRAYYEIKKNSWIFCGIYNMNMFEIEKA